jgi:hypothetical protein
MKMEARGSSKVSVFILPEEIMMAAVGSRKTSAQTSIHRTASSHIPEDGDINLWAYINKWSPATPVWRVFNVVDGANHLQTPANTLKFWDEEWSPEECCTGANNFES